MEFPNSTVLTNPHISPTVLFFSHQFSISNWKSTKKPVRLTIYNSRKLHLHRPLSLYLSHPIASNNFQISAHFCRPTNRKNYLRKKLTEHQKLQQVSPLRNPVHEVNENDKYKSNIDSSREQSNNLGDRSCLDYSYRASGEVKEPETESRKKQFGESIMWNKLESWVEQYKKDSEFWGIGTGPIFTVFQDSEGKVERVFVNEDEIMRRNQVDPRYCEDSEAEGLAEVNFKISFAKDLAKEMENGSNVITSDSSVAKFLSPGRKSGFMESIRGITLKPSLFSTMSRAGVIVLSGLFVIWAIKGLFTVGEDSKEYTRLEKDMLRRKMKARKEKEKMVKGSVEVIQDPTEPKGIFFGRPQLDKGELLNSIVKSKESNNELTVAEDSSYHSKDFEDKIKQIRAMARHAREIEKRESLPDNGDGEDDPDLNNLSNDIMSPENDLPNGNTMYVTKSDETIESNGTESSRADASIVKLVPKSSNLNEVNLLTDGPGRQSDKPNGNSSRTKFRIIKSIKEAREYLSRKHHKLEVNQEPKVRNDEQFGSALTMPSVNEASGGTGQSLDLTDKVYGSSPSRKRHYFLHPRENYKRDTETAERNVDSLDDLQKFRISSFHEVSVSNQVAEMPIYSMLGERETDNKTSRLRDCKNELPSSVGSTSDSSTAEVHCGGSICTEEVLIPLDKHNSEGSEENETVIGLQMHETTSGNEENGRTAELAPSANKRNWIEKNFHEFDPVVKRIGVGFRDNYAAAREKSNHVLDSKTDMRQLKSDGDENELEWMKDERLREIVFKVRDNELAGRDPFHLMDDEDKYAFFRGLEKKVEQENEKLVKLHEYFHVNIENLDYGADGISLYDPPEKIIPRWKIPLGEKNPEFLNNFLEQRKAFVAESLKTSFLTKKTGKDIVRKPEEPSPHENNPVAADVTNQSTNFQEVASASSKTIIEGSDGSVRAGKKSGREYWQHTKKWSQGFLESYNAETDPEVKGVMKDIGKDLDRWITEKEIEEAADLMDKLPEKGQKLVKGKLDKVKREMKLFGPQAVVSKYCEYAEEKEEDYLWWLDLPFVLCIELYTIVNEEQKVGIYSLEMATELELDPKQYHVIAFEDAGDCKNLCYIIQAHMEMLGNGNAFVVARPPKDAFREAKTNGFSVTVIRKGQLQLNVDQTLEEVEELIVEIGSKIFHDKIMQNSSVDIKALMKGVFGINKPAKRKRSKRKLKRRAQP